MRDDNGRSIIHRGPVNHTMAARSRPFQTRRYRHTVPRSPDLARLTHRNRSLGNIARLDIILAAVPKSTMPRRQRWLVAIVHFAYNSSGHLTSVPDALTNASSFVLCTQCPSATDGALVTRLWPRNELLDRREPATSSDSASSSALHHRPLCHL